MSVLHDLSKNIILPKMIRIRQTFNSNSIDRSEIKGIIYKELSNKKFTNKISAGKKICITAGSRGITNIDYITKCIVDFCKDRSAKPFVVPAMGSHGGATAEGQLSMLESYGITEEYLGCPILSSMETVLIGKNEEGMEVYLDKNAMGSDGIIVCNRVKPHTSFRGKIESGIMKMLAIGLAKQYGASKCHSEGFRKMEKNVLLFGRAVLKNAPIICGLAILENPYDETYMIKSISVDEIEEEEAKLLEVAKKNLPCIYFDNIDLLIVDKIGKNYSGSGMDPNITGTFDDPEMTGGVKSKRVVVLDLSDESHGNAAGVNGADLTTKKLVDKYDKEAVYVNAITASIPEGGAIPMVADNDIDCIKTALKTTSVSSDCSMSKVVRISNSLDISEIYISESLIKEAKNNENIEILGKLEEFNFDLDGNLDVENFI